LRYWVHIARDELHGGKRLDFARHELADNFVVLGRSRADYASLTGAENIDIELLAESATLDQQLFFLHA